MQPRSPRPQTRSQAALIHRGPQALSAAHGPPHAPNAALLIDFDNVTMGIRSDLGKELRSLLSSEIIKGKVAVQRAYADWRRYPQYIVPLSESSIDLIFAPAYGSSKKNATDIRLAIDALELVFTRPEIGTFILLSGDSDFSSLVIKLKEYGKYVIGVGIRESSSDLLVQNCDEYYSYNALAGLVKASDEEPVRKWDPWDLVTESVKRMKANGDVMRSDRLKQVMQDIDASFDEKNLNMSKFSRFVEAARERGLVSITKLENGQLEIDLPKTSASTTELRTPGALAEQAVRPEGAAPASEDRPRRGRRGGRGRGRDREREPRSATPSGSMPATEAPVEDVAQAELPMREEAARDERAPVAASVEPPVPLATAGPAIGQGGELLSRTEAFDLVTRAVASLVSDDNAAGADQVRQRARELLGRDSQSLSDRMFIRVLKDAHDAGAIDLRRRGDSFEVARAGDVEPVAEQAARAERHATPAPAAAPTTPRLGMRPRGAGASPRGKRGAPPPELFSIGVVAPPVSTPAPVPAVSPSAISEAPAAEDDVESPAAPAKKRGRKAAKKSAPAEGAEPATPTRARGRAAKTARPRKTRSTGAE
jgi:uncharacterized protein (TIGR00288 family)